MILKFDDKFAQAWFRSCLHRAAMKEGTTEDEEEFLLRIRVNSYGHKAILTPGEVKIVVPLCENKVGDKPGFMEARQRIVNQLKGSH